jgi:hypothetical protein
MSCTQIEETNPYYQLARCKAQLTAANEEIEHLRVQLAGCGVAAMCNTRESMEQQLAKQGDYGWSASYGDVLKAVEREIELREENEGLQMLLQREGHAHLNCINELKRVAEFAQCMGSPVEYEDDTIYLKGIKEYVALQHGYVLITMIGLG